MSREVLELRWAWCSPWWAPLYERQHLVRIPYGEADYPPHLPPMAACGLPLFRDGAEFVAFGAYAMAKSDDRCEGCRVALREMMLTVIEPFRWWVPQPESFVRLIAATGLVLAFLDLVRAA